MEVLSPSRYVHIGKLPPKLPVTLEFRLTSFGADQSPSACLKRIRLHLGEEADEWLRYRVRIIKYV